MTDHLTGVVYTIAKVPGEDGIIACADSGAQDGTRTQAGGAVIAGVQASDGLNHRHEGCGDVGIDHVCGRHYSRISAWSKVDMADYLAGAARAITKVPSKYDIATGADRGVE